MSVPQIAFVRGSTLLTTASVDAYVAAQQIQITRDFAPAWGLGATCLVVPAGGAVPAGAWEVLLLDHSDQADALGYHDDTGPGGAPRSKVFVADDLADGAAWTVTASHETLEMLADPEIDRTARIKQADGSIDEYAWEVCDCCEDDQFAYEIDGVKMSDFALPSWFDSAGKAPFTFRRTVTAPLALAAGGYIGVHEVSPVVTPWQQRLAEGVRGRRTVKGAHSRTIRRFRRLVSADGAGRA